MKATDSAAAVATALLGAPDEHHWGYELARLTDLRSGVLYPILRRMQIEGWLTDGWETQSEVRDSRPPRRYYELTALGRTELVALSARARRRTARHSITTVSVT